MKAALMAIKLGETILQAERQYDLPADARFGKLVEDHMRACWIMIVESETFPEVPSGELFPVLKRKAK